MPEHILCSGGGCNIIVPEVGQRRDHSAVHLVVGACDHQRYALEPVRREARGRPTVSPLITVVELSRVLDQLLKDRAGGGSESAERAEHKWSEVPALRVTFGLVLVVFPLLLLGERTVVRVRLKRVRDTEIHREWARAFTKSSDEHVNFVARREDDATVSAVLVSVPREPQTVELAAELVL